MTKKVLEKVKINELLFYTLAIKVVFPRSENFICSWHVQQNLKKKFCFLNRGNDPKKKTLYREIINLPFSNYPEVFEGSISSIIKSKYISKELKKYLENKMQQKQLFVKGYLKSHFCCGMCTTSRLESKHRVMKRYLNSGKRLTELFQVMKELEDKELNKLKNEIEFKNVKERSKIESSDLINYFNEIYSGYAMERLKDNSIDSVNYKIKKVNQNQWYFIFI